MQLWLSDFTGLFLTKSKTIYALLTPPKMIKRKVVSFVAALLQVPISFPQEKEERPAPKNKDYRLARNVWYDGTVHWRIEQYVSNRLTLEYLFPHYPTEGMVHVNGKPVPNDWIPLPQEFGSEEEAIQYLNETLRSCETLEVSYCYVD